MREIIDMLTRHYRDAAALPKASAPPGGAAGSGKRGCDVEQGLRQIRKTLPSRLLYDRRGRDLLATLAATPEHYQARTELALLKAHGRAIAELVGEGASLVELGGCDPAAVQVLLGELRHPLVYMPIGEAAQVLWSAAMQVQLDFPYVAVRPVIADAAALTELPEEGPWAHQQMLVTLLGSVVAGLVPSDAVALMRRTYRMAPRSLLLVGTALKTDVRVMEAAYNDAAGKAAAFNVNLLLRLNRELDAGFDPEAFRHVAYWNDVCGRIEIYLESRKRQVVRLSGGAITFERGECIQTQSVFMYTVGQFQRLASRAGYVPEKAWIDRERRYCLHALIRKEEASH